MRILILCTLMMPTLSFAESASVDRSSGTFESFMLAASPSETNQQGNGKVVADEQPRPFNEVPVNASAPGSVRINKPFIVVFRFRSPVTGFTLNSVSVSQGKIIYFAGNNASTVFRAQILADQELDTSSDNAYVSVDIRDTVNGTVSKRVQLLPPPVEKVEPVGIVYEPLDWYGYLALQASRGGDTVDTESTYNIGNTEGAWIGFSYPLLPCACGSFRLVVGTEQQEEGSRDDGDYMKFSTTNLDLLYDIRYSDSFNILAGLTSSLNGSMEVQQLRIVDEEEGYDAEVDFESSYGFKLIFEYIPLRTSSIDLFISGSFTVMDYLPDNIKLQTTDDSLTSPTRIGGSSFKLSFGIRI